MNPMDVACRACAAQPDHECERWSELDGSMMVVPGLVHPERIEDAGWEAAMNDPAPAPTEEQFGDAVTKSGLF